MPAPVHKIFVGGGGDDWFSNIVENYEADYSKLNPDYTCRYFSWTSQGAVTDLIRDLPREAHVTVVGHSYGADAAFSAVTASRAVDVLVSIDPVGRIGPSWASIRSAARIWLNARAEPSRERRRVDDGVAFIGGKYPRPPAPGEAGAPDHSLIVDINHGSFRVMMRAAGRGSVSGAALLGGVRVP